jgi:hypothetical protein
MFVQLTDAEEQSSSSYECDGCGHHASFHTMENKAEDEIRKRWEVEAKEKAEREEEEVQQRPKKRVRTIEYNQDGDLDFGLTDGELDDLLPTNAQPRNNSKIREAGTLPQPKARARAAPRKKPTARAASSKTKSRLDELYERVMYVELD